MNTCLICSRQYKYTRSKGGTATKCNSCCVNERRILIRKKVVEYLGGKCVVCGFHSCLGAMHAHHTDPSKKDFNISGAHSRSWKSIVKELDKCILLCANCHFSEHHDCQRYGCHLGVSPHSYKMLKG